MSDFGSLAEVEARLRYARTSPAVGTSRLVSLADIGMKVCSSTKHGKTLDKPHGSH